MYIKHVYIASVHCTQMMWLEFINLRELLLYVLQNIWYNSLVISSLHLQHCDKTRFVYFSHKNNSDKSECKHVLFFLSMHKPDLIWFNLRARDMIHLQYLCTYSSHGILIEIGFMPLVYFIGLLYNISFMNRNSIDSRVLTGCCISQIIGFHKRSRCVNSGVVVQLPVQIVLRSHCHLWKSVSFTNLLILNWLSEHVVVADHRFHSDF